MLNKKMIVPALIILTLLTISTVSAADSITGAENQDNIISEDLTSNTDKSISMTFTDLNGIINDNDKTDIYLNCNFTYNQDSDSSFKEGININHDVTIHGNAFTINGDETASMFKVTQGNVVFKDIVFANGSGIRGGAINGKCTAINCTFTGNSARDYGGAIFSGSAVNCTFINNAAVNYGGGAIFSGPAVNCTFIGNSARYGGAMSGGNAVNCTFINNHAEFGGAMSGKASYAANSTFINNSATDYGGAMSYGSAANSTFTGNSAVNYGGGMYDASVVNCTFINNSAIRYGGGAIFSGDAVRCAFIHNDIVGVDCENCTFIPAETVITAQNITTAYGVCKKLAITLTDIDGNVLSGAQITVSLNNAAYKEYTDSNGEASITVPDNLNPNTYKAIISYCGDSEYLPSNTTASIVVNKADVSMSTTANSTELVVILTHNTTSKAISGAKINANINGTDYSSKTNANGRAKFSTAYLPPGTYKATVSYKGNSKYNPASKSIDIVTKTNIIISAVYDEGNNEIIALLTNEATGKAVSGANVKVSLNGETTTVKTNSKGQIKVSSAGLPLGTCTATVSYAGNSKYNPASTSINFDVKTKVIITDVYGYTDKLVATLTNAATGKPIVNAYMEVEINGMTKTAKSNSKSQISIDTSDVGKTAYDVTISYGGNSRYALSSTSTTIDLNKANMIITYAYNANKQIVATLKNSKTGKAVSNANMVVDMNGVKTTLKSNSKGQITFPTKDFAPGTYVGTITYGGNARYNSISTAFKADV